MVKSLTTQRLIRYMVASFVLYLGLFYILSVLGNLTDLSDNLKMIQRLLTMEGSPASAGVAWRSIQSPLLINLAYWVIILVELAIAFFGCWGGLILFGASHKSVETFDHAKRIALIAIGLGIALYFFGYLVLADQWFRAWMSHESENIEQLGFTFVTFLSLLFIMVRQTK